MNKTCRLIVDDREMELPIVTGTGGERGIDISSQRAQRRSRRHESEET